MGQNLAGGRQRTQLDVGVKGGLGGQTQQSNVVPEKELFVTPNQLRTYRFDQQKHVG